MPLRGGQNSSEFYSAIYHLKVGENLFITAKEWNRPKTPSRICRYIEKKFPVKYKCQSHAQNQGWVVKRVS
jgi:hypothetical protein